MPKNNLTVDQVMEAITEDDNIGFCIACGEEHSCIEPDARNYTCESCGEDKVFGAEQILLEGLVQ